MSNRSNSKVLVIFAIVLIAVLAVFSVYEFMRADSVSQAFSQAQMQNSGLTDQLQDIQQKSDSLQSQNATLHDQVKALQSQINAAPTAAASKPNQKTAYLTFDDGPSEYTSHLLNELNELGVKATFFVSFQGGDSKEKRSLLEQEVKDGHTIGVHCWNHSYSVCYASEQAFLDDFNHMKNVIVDVTGITPKINRFPGGTDNTASMTHSHEILMPTLEKDVVAMGFKTFDWNAGGEDADQDGDKDKPSTSEQFVQKILRDAATVEKPNLVILMHDNISLSVNAVPELVKELRKKGYTFEMLSPTSPTEIRPYHEPFSGLKDPSDSSAQSGPSSES